MNLNKFIYDIKNYLDMSFLDREVKVLSFLFFFFLSRDRIGCRAE